MKVKSQSELSQSCRTLRDPVDCSLPGSHIHGIFQARVLEWVAIAFSTVSFIFNFSVSLYLRSGFHKQYIVRLFCSFLVWCANDYHLVGVVNFHLLICLFFVAACAFSSVRKMSCISKCIRELLISQMVQWVKNPPANAGDVGLILGSGNTLEEVMTTHSSVLAWRIPWTEEPGGLQSMGSQRVRHN